MCVVTRKVVTKSWRGVLAGIALILAGLMAPTAIVQAQEPVTVTGDAHQEQDGSQPGQGGRQTRWHEPAPMRYSRERGERPPGT